MVGIAHVLIVAIRGSPGLSKPAGGPKEEPPLRLYANSSGSAQAAKALTTASPICAVPTRLVPSL